MTKEEHEQLKWFAMGAIAALFEQGSMHWDEWYTVTTDWDVNVYKDLSHYKATAYRVKDSKTDTSKEHELVWETLL